MLLPLVPLLAYAAVPFHRDPSYRLEVKTASRRVGPDRRDRLHVGPLAAAFSVRGDRGGQLGEPAERRCRVCRRVDAGRPAQAVADP